MFCNLILIGKHSLFFTYLFETTDQKSKCTIEHSHKVYEPVSFLFLLDKLQKKIKKIMTGEINIESLLTFSLTNKALITKLIPKIF